MRGAPSWPTLHYMPTPPPAGPRPIDKQKEPAMTTTTTSSRFVRFARRVAEMWNEIDEAQRRMFEIRIGVRAPARREHEARRLSAAGTAPGRAGGGLHDGAAAGLMC
jgi:hypothetical protein